MFQPVERVEKTYIFLFSISTPVPFLYKLRNENALLSEKWYANPDLPPGIKTGTYEFLCFVVLLLF